MANSEKRNDENSRCDFCGKHANDVDHLFAGPAVFICDKCVKKMSEMMTCEKNRE